MGSRNPKVGRTSPAFDRITVEPGKCGGKPCICGMRITVRRVLEILASYRNRDDVLREYPLLEEEDLTHALPSVVFLRIASRKAAQPAELLEAIWRQCGEAMEAGSAGSADSEIYAYAGSPEIVPHKADTPLSLPSASIPGGLLIVSPLWLSMLLQMKALREERGLIRPVYHHWNIALMRTS